MDALKHAKLEQLKTAYSAALAVIVAEKPDAYAWPASELPKVTQRMCAAIDKYKGVGGINLDGPAFRRVAREFGIKNTYKAWKEWLA